MRLCEEYPEICEYMEFGSGVEVHVTFDSDDNTVAYALIIDGYDAGCMLYEPTGVISGYFQLDTVGNVPIFDY